MLGPSQLASCSGNFMRLTAGGLLAALALGVGPSGAQPAPPAAAEDCVAQKVAITQAMDTARAKGQMLQRRRLAETLAQLEERCSTAAPASSRAAEIQRLEDEVRTLQEALERAQARLRTLRSETP